MQWLNNLKDALRRKKSRDFAQELANQFFSSPICSDYENLFAQVRPLIDEMKTVMPYGVTDRGRKLPVSRTPELEWLKNPNDDMGWAEFADLMFATWLTEDELDIHVWRKPNGKVEGYTIIPPECRIYLGYGRWEWQVMTTDGLEVLDEDQVMRLRFSRSPRNVQKGVSPASAVRVWAQIDDLIAQYQRAYFENGAIPATITFITASTREKYENTRKELENNLKGARNRNKTVYAWRQFNPDDNSSVDQVEVKTIQGNNSTLAIKDIVEIVNDRLNKSIGVSNFILGDDSSAKYDNAELSDHQFTKRRVYPALMSFWNQFQHELDRILGGLGYGISFDLEIPELTERVKARAEIARIRAESLVNLISAGASGNAAVEALGLPENWVAAAEGIYNKGITGALLSPISVDYSLPEGKAKTKDEASKSPKAKKADAEACCTCHHSLDELPPMTEQEQRLYKVLVDLAESIKQQHGIKNLDVDKAVQRMTELLKRSALDGEKSGAQALALLAKKDVASEILKTISNGEYYVSEALEERISQRAKDLAKGYVEYTNDKVQEVLNTPGLSANQIESQLAEVFPKKLRYRAEAIARNETTYAIRSGRLERDEELAEKYGLNVYLVWETSHDNKVCPVCAAMQGKKVKLGNSFDDTITAEDGEIITWEKDSWNDNGRITSAHVNCRCYWNEVLE